jgi:hypothetical protein
MTMTTTETTFTTDQLAAIYYALANEHNKLLAEKRDRTKPAHITQIVERQYNANLDALVAVQAAIEANA